MTVSLMLALALSAQVPPPIVSVSVPPPPMIVTNSPPPLLSMPAPSRPPVQIQVRAQSGVRVLLDDSFSVGAASASFMQNRSESLPSSCEAPAYRSTRSSMMLSIRPEGSATADTYRVSFNWSRPASGCAEGSRGASLEQSVTLAPGATAVIGGDGGLKVELRRK